MKVKYLVGAIPMLLMCSCDNELNNIVGGNTSEKAIITTSPYEFEDGTRTVLTNTGSAISFAWDDNEAIGIFPIAPTTNSQAKQVITKKEGSTTTAVFDGAGWELKKGNTYAAYYPYKDLMSSATYDAVPVDYTGQVQDGNGNLDHIGANYDYMYAVSGEPTNGIVNFDLKHIGSIVMLELTMPDAGEWKDITLTAGSDVFTTKGTMNVSNGTISATTKSKSISLELKNVSTTSANQAITLYTSVLPATTGEIKATVTNTSGKKYTATLVGKTLNEGIAYKWSTITKKTALPPGNGSLNGYKYVDLGLSVKWATMNIGATAEYDYGNYYAWGEVTGCKRDADGSHIAAIMDGYSGTWTGEINNRYVNGDKKYDYGSWYYCSSYKWGKYSNNFYAYKYNTRSSNGFVDNKTTLEPEDDAATVNWGEGWRMPTTQEHQELLKNVTSQWVSNYRNSGVSGVIFTSKVSGYSGNSIFLPASGYIRDSQFRDVNEWGTYWSASLHDQYDESARVLGFYNNGFAYWESNSDFRYIGLPIRAVCQ